MYCCLNIAVLLMTASVLQGHVYQKSNANVSSFTGKLINLRELNVNYNKLLSIPPELGECENLERLEMTANRNLTELPFEVRQDDQHIQYSYAHFNTFLVCVIRFPAEKSQKIDALGHGGESVCQYSCLCASYGEPEVSGHQQQQTQRPAGGYGQVCVRPLEISRVERVSTWMGDSGENC